MHFFRRLVVILFLGLIAIFFQGTALKALSADLFVPNILVLFVVYLNVTIVTVKFM